MSEKVKVKGKHKKRFLKFLCIFLCVIIVYVAVTTLITVIGLKANRNKIKTISKVAYENQLVPENYDNGCWNIKTDRDIKVVQLTDVHLGGGYLSINKDSKAINAVAAMLTAEKPDLVIVTGDISYPVPFQAGTFNNKSGATLFAELMESLGIYWTACYGNHDTESYSYYSREQLTEIYSSGDFPHCLLQAGPEDVDGCGNQVINIVNSDNVIARSLILFDSHSYIDGDVFGIAWKYDNIHDNQIEWYKNTVKALTEQNAQTVSKLSADRAALYDASSPVKTSAFMHIPLNEYKTAWNEYVDNGYKDDENITYNYGTAGESGKVIYCGVHDDMLFETMLELGSTDSIFCGHDHLNNFSINYKSINLNYGMSIDYLAYSGISRIGSQRGCSILSIDTEGNLTSKNENYYQDKYLSPYEKEDVTMQELNSNMP